MIELESSHLRKFYNSLNKLKKQFEKHSFTKVLQDL